MLIQNLRKKQLHIKSTFLKADNKYAFVLTLK